jgi:hypothetical protein
VQVVAERAAAALAALGEGRARGRGDRLAGLERDAIERRLEVRARGEDVRAPLAPAAVEDAEREARARGQQRAQGGQGLGGRLHVVRPQHHVDGRERAVRGHRADALDRGVEAGRARGVVAALPRRAGEAHAHLGAARRERRHARRMGRERDAVREQAEEQAAREDVLREVERPRHEQGLAAQQRHARARAEERAHLVDDREHRVARDLALARPRRVRAAEVARQVALVRELQLDRARRGRRLARRATEAMAGELGRERGGERVDRRALRDRGLHARDVGLAHGAEERVPRRDAERAARDGQERAVGRERGGGVGRRGHRPRIERDRPRGQPPDQSTEGTTACTRVDAPRTDAGARNGSAESSRRMHSAAASKRASFAVARMELETMAPSGSTRKWSVTTSGGRIAPSGARQRSTSGQ